MVPEGGAGGVRVVVAREVRVPAVRSSELEESISRLPWVRGARVVVSPDGVIKEVHILAGPGSHPALLSKQVETLLRARWGIALDRRKVSIACLSGSAGEQPRVRLAAVEAMDGRVLVRLELPRLAGQDSPVRHSGVADAAEGSRDGLALAAARAAQAALGAAAPAGWEFGIRGARVVEAGGEEVAVVLVRLTRPGLPEEELAGAALVRADGPAWAGARACLDAVNRVLPAAFSPGGIDRKSRGL